MFRFISLAFLGLALAYPGSEFSSQVRADLDKLVEGKPLTAQTGSSTVQRQHIQFRVFNRNTPEGFEVNSTNIDEIPKYLEMKFLVHDWGQTPTNGYVLKMKETYLRKQNVNVIIVDWTIASQRSYPQAAIDVPKVGDVLGQFMVDIVNSKLDEADNVKTLLGAMHVIGFGMGGHVAGTAGQHYEKQTTKKVYRITALDASGPIFESKPEHQRLSADDAQLVENIHTDGRHQGFGIGFTEPLAKIDYYPNGGSVQPGCPNPNPTDPEPRTLKKKSNISGAIWVLCSHLRAIELWTESIETSDYFVARRCNSYGEYMQKKCEANLGLMGEEAPEDQEEGKYYLKTNSQYPFGRGSDVTTPMAIPLA